MIYQHTVDTDMIINNPIENITYIRTVFWTITYKIICKYYKLQATYSIVLSIISSYSDLQHRREGTVSLSQTTRRERRKCTSTFK